MSTTTYNAFFAAQWLVYLIRLVLRLVYGVLQFISKPGSRYLVPLGLAALAYAMRPELHQVTGTYLDGFLMGMSGDPYPVAWAKREAMRAYYGYTIEPWILDAVLVAALLTIAVFYALLSRMLPIVLGAFPQVTTPLRPMRRLVATSAKVNAAVVKIAVPKLPPRTAVRVHPQPEPPVETPAIDETIPAV